MQGQYLAFIDAYVRMHGCAPAESELQRHFGVTPPSVHQMVLTLERKGLINRVPGAARSLTLQVETADLPPLEPPRQRVRHSATNVPASASPLPIKSRSRTREKKRTKPDAMSEYVDGSLMTHRLRYKEGLSAHVAGRYGVYRTSALLTSPVICDCTCPSEEFPCKHVRALRKTWEVNPASFLDLHACLSGLAVQPKARLIDAIGQLLLIFPQALGHLGIRGFEAESGAEDWADDE